MGMGGYGAAAAEDGGGCAGDGVHAAIPMDGDARTRPNDPDRKEWDRMQGRSWMAALSIAVALAGVDAPGLARAGDPTPIKQKVTLNIRFSGLVGQKAEVVVKPGNPACRFKPIARAIDPDVVVPFGPFDVETFSADGDCSFAITIKEPGQPDKTIRRILQIPTQAEAKAAGAKPGDPVVLTCYVSSRSLSGPAAELPAVADKAEQAKRKK